MAAADSTHLDAKGGAAFGQPQPFGAVLEQTSIPEFQVQPPRGDLGEMRDQPRALPMFLLGEEFGLPRERGRRELANLPDERGE